MWIVQKVPRTGKEDTAQGIRIAYIAYYPILYPGPLGVHPLIRVPLGSLTGKESLWDSGFPRIPTGYEPKNIVPKFFFSLLVPRKS